MTFKTLTENGVVIAVAQAEEGETILRDASSALELAVSAQAECGARRIVLAKSAVCDAFFVLSSGVAGEILQKYVNYQFKLAVYGDFSGYTSKPLHDFLWESNRGKDAFFVATEREAIERLAKA